MKRTRYRKMLLRLLERSLVPNLDQIISLAGGAFSKDHRSTLNLCRRSGSLVTTPLRNSIGLLIAS